MLGKWSGEWGSCQKSEERDVYRDARPKRGLGFACLCSILLVGWFSGSGLLFVDFFLAL